MKFFSFPKKFASDWFDCNLAPSEKKKSSFATTLENKNLRFCFKSLVSTLYDTAKDSSE